MKTFLMAVLAVLIAGTALGRLAQQLQQRPQVELPE